MTVDPKPTKAIDSADPEERLEFRVAVLAADGGCVVHDDPMDCRGRVSAHHCITQQQLRKAGRVDLLWSPANGFAVCEKAHLDHHSRSRPITLDVVPQRCVAFAREHGFGYVLERTYATNV